MGVIVHIGTSVHELLHWLVALLVQLSDLFDGLGCRAGHQETFQEAFLELFKSVDDGIGLIPD